MQGNQCVSSQVGLGGAWWEVRWRKLGSDTVDGKDLAFRLE